MTRNEIRNGLQNTLDSLKELEARARKLQNQNLADVAKSAWGRVEQLLGHADVELMGNDAPNEPRTADTATYTDQAPGGVRQTAPLPFDPKAGAPIGGNGDAPGSQVGGPDRGKENVHVPGEPRFDQENRDFTQPNAVDLNSDGTMRQAPNSLGAQPDVREGA